MTNQMTVQQEKQLNIMPQNKQDVLQIAEVIWNGQFAPHLKTQQQLLAAIHKGLEVGLSPMAAAQQIAVINNRPVIWGDAAMALVQGSGELEDLIEEFVGKADDLTAICIVKRKGRKSPIKREFSVEDAKTAGLWGRNVWKQYPKRMLQMRARGFALRDCFADVLNGIGIREEIEDYPTRPVEQDITEKEPLMIDFDATETPQEALEAQDATIEHETMQDEPEANPEPKDDMFSDNDPKNLLYAQADAAAKRGKQAYIDFCKGCSKEEQDILKEGGESSMHEICKQIAGIN